MGASIRPEQFDRAGAKAAGYTDEEIDAFLASQAPVEPKRSGRDSRVAGLGGQLAQGATFGLANPIMAAAGTAVRKLQGDDRPLREIYGQLKGDVDEKDREYRQDYPVTALGANVVGGLASPASVAVNAVRPFSAVGWAGRAGNAMAQGALTGGVAAGVNAEPGERLSSAALGSALGGALGFGFSAGADAIGQGARAAGLGPRAANDLSRTGNIIRRVRGAVGAETADDAGARRALQIIRREGKSLDDLAAANATADAPDVLGEVIGNRGVRGLRTARMVGDQAPGQIDEALADRAMDEAGRLRTLFQRLTGANRADVQEVAEEAMARVKPVTDELYASAREVDLGTDAQDVARVVNELDADGFGVFRLARKLGGMPESLGAPPARNQALDVVEEAAASARSALDDARGALGEMESYGLLIESVDADALRARSPHLTAAMRRKNTMAKKRPGSEVLSRGEKRELGYDLTEDARARIEEAGWTPDEFRSMVQRGRDAMRRMPALEQRAAKAEQALEEAVRAAGGTPPPPLTVGQALKVRQALDAMIDDSAERSADRIVQARLVEARAAVDRIVKRAGGNQAAASAVQEADALFTDAKRIGESFRDGVRAAQSGDMAAASRIVRRTAKPEQARAGIGNELLRRLGQVADEGRVQNPAPRVTGGEERRAITRMAFPDDASFEQFRGAANNATRRLATRNVVSGGSQTADKLADALDFAADPSLYTDAVTGNTPGMLRRLLQTGVVRRLAGANAAEADEMAKYLLAGAPGQMSREQAIQRLRELAPGIEGRLNLQATRRGVAGGAAASTLLRR